MKFGGRFDCPGGRHADSKFRGEPQGKAAALQERISLRGADGTLDQGAELRFSLMQRMKLPDDAVIAGNDDVRF